MKEDEVADIILGRDAKGDGFRLKWHGLTLRLRIKPVSTRSLIKISREVAHIPDINPNGEMAPEQMTNAESLNHICKAIAIATGTRFPRIVSKAIAELPLKDVKVLWSLVLKNCDPTSFFFIIISTKGGINKLSQRPQEKSKEAKLSSAK